MEPAYPPWAFKAGLLLAILAICGISFFYIRAFLPKLRDVVAIRALADEAAMGNATAQLEMAKKYKIVPIEQ